MNTYKTNGNLHNANQLLYSFRSVYRGNLHTHSTRSDGALSLEEVCRRYQVEGYDFIALTDHFVGLFDYPISDTSSFRKNVITTILGAELHTGSMQNGHLWHLLASR